MTTTLHHLSKTQKTQSQTTLMLWGGNRQLQEYTQDNIFTTIYDQDSFVPVVRIVQQRHGTNNQDKSKGNDEFKLYHYHTNHLGTPQELTDDTGDVIWLSYDYAWGGQYEHYYKEQHINGTAIDKDHLQPIKFQGQYYDTETSLHYNRFRYYDTDVGMFIQRDPIGLLGGDNVFAYAPSPVGWVDPLGLLPSVPEENVAVLVGYGDGLTLGTTKYIREKLDISSPSCTSCIELYNQGSKLGAEVTVLAAGGRVLHKPISKTINNSLSSPKIGHRLFTANRKNGSWNSGKTRFSWSGKNGSSEYKLMFRYKDKHFPTGIKTNKDTPKR